jgi:predicted MFS family arabinose efflux permease
MCRLRHCLPDDFDGYVTTIAKQGRSAAVGLYVTFFYVGGSVGAVLPGLTWTKAGWPATVGMLLVSQALMATVVWLIWPRESALA